MGNSYQREPLPDWVNALGDDNPSTLSSINSEFNMLEKKHKKSQRNSRNRSSMKRSESSVWIHDDDVPFLENSAMLKHLVCLKGVRRQFSNVLDDCRTLVCQVLYEDLWLFVDYHRPLMNVLQDRYKAEVKIERYAVLDRGTSERKQHKFIPRASFGSSNIPNS